MTYVQQLLGKMREAKTEPSETCITGKEHQFTVMSHSDGEQSYAIYSRCLRCSEIIVKEEQRIGRNQNLWRNSHESSSV